jgi:hypothetical protein
MFFIPFLSFSWGCDVHMDTSHAATVDHPHRFQTTREPTHDERGTPQRFLDFRTGERITNGAVDGCIDLRPHAWAAVELVELRHAWKKRRDKKVQHSQCEEPGALRRHCEDAQQA